MFGYYIDLAWRSVCRHPGLTALTVLAIGLGIGASMTMLTVLHNLSGDPLPQRSAVLYHPQVDPRPIALSGATSEPPDDLVYADAVNLYHMGGASRRALMSSNWLPVRRDAPASALSMETTRATSRGFFSMFDVPFLYGSAWSDEDDERHAAVIVLSRKLNLRLFGGVNSVGKNVVVATKTFRVVGVIDNWNPQPHFYDLNSKAYGSAEQIYLPFFTWLDLPQDYGYGPMRCWGSDPGAGLHDPKNSQCSWVQFWVQLDTAAQVSSYRALLVNYSEQQHEQGRFERSPNVRLRGLLDWLDAKHVIPVTVRMQTWIAFGVFGICLVNAVGLMVARFLRQSGEIGVRRALGASYRQVFLQCLVEAGLLGALGGVLGLPLAWLGLWMVRQQPVSFASSTNLDPAMLGVAMGLAVFAALLAGLWPSWRAARILPAMQMKSL